MTYQKKQVIDFSKRPENQLCADCKAPNPRWGLIHLGIFVCQDCSKYHQTIEKGKYKAKSLGDDTWTTEEALMMKHVGNEKSNQYYEFFLPEHHRPTSSNEAEMTKFIKNKYEDEYWANKKKLRPSSKILHFIEDASFIGTFCFRLGIFLFFIVLFFVLLLLKLCKLNRVVQSFSLNLLIASECLLIDCFNEIGWVLIFQIIVGIFGFGFNFVKAAIVVTSTKLFRFGLISGRKGIFLFVIACAIIYIGFGFENMLISISSLLMWLFNAFQFFNAAKNKNIKMFWEI